MKKNGVIIGGIYRHFKGNMYLVIDIAKHSETLEDMVVYKALYGEGQLYTRPLSMWNEIVERDGLQTLRFVYVDNTRRLCTVLSDIVNRQIFYVSQMISKVHHL